MANILMINVPYTGHTNPTLPLAAGLVQRGHSVVYVNSSTFKDQIEATGANFIPYSDFPEDLSAQQIKTRCFKDAFNTAMQLTDKFDLLIYEMLFYPGKILADKLGIPCVRQFSQHAWNYEMTCDAGLFWRLSCKLIDFQGMGKRTAAAIGTGGKTLIDSVLNDRPELNVVYVPKLFQPKIECFDESYVFVCPPMKVVTTSHVKIPYDTMKKPIIYISLGSIISSRRFCKRCIKSFGDKDLSVILNTGKIDLKTLGPIPPNIFAYPFVPQIQVLANADLFITHCGMNSVNEAMSFGIPLLAMPVINDQITNAKRIVELGIGMRMHAFPITANRLYRNALRVLENDETVKHASCVKEKIGSENNFSDIVIKIEECMN